jgi:hypothetical protein
VSLSGALAVARSGNIGIVADSPPAPGKPHSIVVQTPSGTRSESQFKPGELRLEATGRPDVGTRGEPQVLDILKERLTQEGTSVSPLSGALNSRGEDGLWAVGGQRCTVQVTSVPASPDYWRRVAAGSASTVVDEDAAIAWLRRAVEMKATLSDRATAILAIDARHAGILADPGLADEYRRRFGSPVQEFGFSDAWVVGPTPSHCTRL